MCPPPPASHYILKFHAVSPPYFEHLTICCKLECAVSPPPTNYQTSYHLFNTCQATLTFKVSHRGDTSNLAKASVFLSVTIRQSTGNYAVAPISVIISPLSSFLIAQKECLNQKTYLAKLDKSGLKPTDPNSPCGAPWWSFWILQALPHCMQRSSAPIGTKLEF